MKLEKGEIICDKCKGSGISSNKKIPKIKYFCPKCLGFGKLDWIENITGSKNNMFFKILRAPILSIRQTEQRIPESLHSIVITTNSNTHYNQQIKKIKPKTK